MENMDTYGYCTGWKTRFIIEEAKNIENHYYYAERKFWIPFVLLLNGKLLMN